VTSKPVITIYRGISYGKEVFILKFSYNKNLIETIKAQFKARWDPDKKHWHFRYSEKNLQHIKQVLENDYQLNFTREQINASETLPDNIKVIMERDAFNNRLYVHFPYARIWVNAIRKLDAAWWHQGEKIWSVSLSEENIKKVRTIFKDAHPTFVLKTIHHTHHRKQTHKLPVDRTIVDKEYIRQLNLLNRSEHTINNYTSMIARFLHYFKNEDIGRLPEKQIKKYIHHHREKQGYSESYQRLMISALKSYYKIIYKRKLDEEEIPFPKKSKRLPKVISQKDVENMIRLTVNPKHRMILLMLYGLGLRNSELSNLRLTDIDFRREIITIYNAKGRKDRQIPLPDALTEPIKRYIRDFVPKEFFITGQFGGQYSGSSIDKVVRQAAGRAKVKFNVTPHVLRHCFATHSLEKGIDLRYIQVMLGHKSSRTTEIYTHVSTRHLKKVGNPLDDITI
jgi:integrase/recombinase XerD